MTLRPGLGERRFRGRLILNDSFRERRDQAELRVQEPCFQIGTVAASDQIVKPTNQITSGRELWNGTLGDGDSARDGFRQLVPGDNYLERPLTLIVALQACHVQRSSCGQCHVPTATYVGVYRQMP
jgi:hypothetical protein